MTEAEELKVQEEEAKQAEEAEAEEAKAEEEEEQHEEDNEPREVSSTMVASWAYNEEAEEIEVAFVNGHEESYSCTPSQWEDAKASGSAGKWMWETVL